MSEPAVAPRSWTLTIPFDIALTSPNARLSWKARWRRNDIARTIAEGVWVEAGKPRASGKVMIGITIRKARKMDGDNVVSSAKPLLDALFARRRIQIPGKPAYYEPGLMTIDDSDKYVQIGTIQQVIGPQFKANESVTFTIVEM